MLKPSSPPVLAKSPGIQGFVGRCLHLRSAKKHSWPQLESVSVCEERKARERESRREQESVWCAERHETMRAKEWGSVREKEIKRRKEKKKKRQCKNRSEKD